MFFLKPLLVLFFAGQVFNCPNSHAENKIGKPRAYYISPSGNDQNDGSLRAPFQSLRRIGQQELTPGDSIFFEGGREFNGSLRLGYESSGDNFHPLFIGAYGKGYATLNSGNEAAIILDQVKWLIIKKLKLTGSGRKQGNRMSGLSILRSHHIIADSLEISGFQKSGLRVDSSQDIFLLNIFAHENGFAGISVGGTTESKKLNQRIYIKRCRAENNPGDPTNLNNHSGNGIVVSSCTNVIIEYCTATNNGWDMPRKGNGPVGIWAFEADSVIIQHCLSYRNKTSAGGADGGGFDFDGGVTHSVIQYCLSYENQGAGYCIFQYLYASPWHDNVIRYNISENDGSVSDAGAGIYIWNSSRDSGQFFNSSVYNNTIYNSKAAAISYSELSERKGFTFYNNIFVARDSLVHGNKGHDIFLGNYWSSLKIGTLSGPDFEKKGKTAPANAVGIKDFEYYKIPLNSPLRIRGINLWNAFRIDAGGTDFNGGIPPATGIGASF